MTKTSVLIIGAGPVGLTAAIECARLGMDVSIIERNSGPTDESRAVGVNRQSLLLLEPSGAERYHPPAQHTAIARRVSR